MERSLVDGVAVGWRSEPGPLRAELLFAVGIRDETLDTLGVTDTVAALATAVWPVGRWRMFVGVDHTSFELTGSPDEVNRGLMDLCTVLADPPVERPEALTGMFVGMRMTLPDTSGRLLLHRYGPSGPGLALWPVPSYAALPPQTVRAYADAHFVSGNAALTLTGPPSPDLRLPLLQRPRPERAAATPVPPSGPQWFDAAGADVRLGVRAGRQAASFVACQVLMRRLQDAVDDAALPYAVDQDDVPIDADWSEMSFELRPTRPELAQPQAAAELAWRELRRLASVPPTVEEIAAAAQRCYSFSGMANILAYEDVEAVLYGLPPVWGPNPRAAATAVTATELHDVAVAWMQSAVLVVPQDVPINPPGMLNRSCLHGTVVPPGRVLRRRLRQRLISAKARRERLILGENYICRINATGQAHTMAFADILVAVENHRARVVHGPGGCVIDVDPHRFAHTRDLIRAIDDRVPPGRRLRMVS